MLQHVLQRVSPWGAERIEGENEIRQKEQESGRQTERDTEKEKANEPAP